MIKYFLYIFSKEIAAKSCITPDNQAGECIAIQQCRPLYSPLLNRHVSKSLTNEERDFLRQSQCDIDNYTPRVQTFNYYTFRK